MRVSSSLRNIGIAGLAILILLATPTTQAVTIQELEARLDRLRKQDQALRDKAQSFRSLIGQVNQEITGIKRDIQTTTYEINTLESELERTRNEIELTNLQIQKLGLEVEKTLAEIEDTKVKTSDVLKNLYQAERVSNIELILAGSNFAEFWDQHQYFSSFQTSLNGLIRQMEVLKSDLEAKIAEQEQKRADLRNLEEKKTIQQNALADKREQQKVLLAQNEAEKKGYQSSLSAAEGERGKLIGEILRIEEEVKRLHNFELYFKSGKVPPPGTKIFVWPAKDRKLTQGYGATAFARSGVAGYRFHNGVDIDGDIGDPIYAAAPGRIVGKSKGSCPSYGRLRDFGCQGGWGNWIAIQHANGLVTLYAHMANPSGLAVGRQVAAGETIGFIGSSGNVTGAHLHFSVYTEFFLVPKGYPGYNPEGTLNPLSYL